MNTVSSNLVALNFINEPSTNSFNDFFSFKDDTLIFNKDFVSNSEIPAFYREIQFFLNNPSWSKLQIEGEGQGIIDRKRLEEHIDVIKEIHPNQLAKILKRSEKAKIHLVEYEDNNSFALHKAAVAGREDILAEFLSRIPVDKLDSMKRTPLQIAAYFGHLSIVRLLIHLGADLKLKTAIPHAIFQACLNNEIEIVNFLVKHGADVNYSFGDNGLTPLLKATLCGFKEMVSTLVKHGADIEKSTIELGNTPLHIAANNNLIEIAEILLKSGAAVNKENKIKSTPVHLAARRGYPNMVMILIREGANLNSTNKDGETPLYQLDAYNHPQFKEIKEWLYKHLNTNTLSFSKELVYRHMMGNMLEISRKEFKGFGSSYFCKIITNKINHFKNTYPDILTYKNAQKLVNALNCSNSSEKILKRCLANKPAFINTGFNGHYVAILIWGDRLFIFNRGGCSRKPVEVFQFDTHKLKSEMIENIQILRLSYLKEHDYKNYMFKKLPSLLNFRQGGFEKALEKKLQLPFQRVGNCSWASSEAAIWGFLAYQGLKNNSIDNPDQQKFDQVINSQKVVFDKWLSFSKMTIFQKYLRKISKADYPFPPPYYLLSDSFLNIFQNFTTDDQSLNKELCNAEEKMHLLIPKEKKMGFNAKKIFCSYKKAKTKSGIEANTLSFIREVFIIGKAALSVFRISYI